MFSLPPFLVSKIPLNACICFPHFAAVNKQINDKERIAAAMENPNLKELVERCVTEDDR